MAFDATIMRPTQFGQVVALTDAATVATDASLGFRFTLSTATSRTLGVPTNKKDGDVRIWEVTNTAGAEVTLTLTTTAGGFAPMETIEATPAIVFETAMAIPAGEILVFMAYYSAAADIWFPLSVSATV